MFGVVVEFFIKSVEVGFDVGQCHFFVLKVTLGSEGFNTDIVYGVSC